MQYAGFWTRFLAALLDGLVLAIPSIIISSVTKGIEGAETLGLIIGILMGWLYDALLESSSKQATLGKQALGIVVTDLNGERISFGRATVRHFSKFLSGIIFLIGYIMAAFTKRKQALHDMIAGTLVVKK